MRILYLISSIGVALGINSIALTASSPAQANFYKGKTITMLIPVPGGSGLDVIARTFANAMTKYISGVSTIVPKNMPGAGGIKSMNFLFDKGKPDGLIIRFGPWNAAGVVAKAPGIRFDPQQLVYIGSHYMPNTTIIRTDAGSGLKSSADIIKAGRFKVGGRGPTQTLDMAGNLALDIMGAKYKYVPGYRGMAKINPALRSNEVQAGHSGYIGYNRFFRDTLIKDGKALALWYHSDFGADGKPQNSPLVTEFPSFHDVYKKVHGKMPSGPKWRAFRWVRTNEAQMTLSIFAPKGTPPEAAAELRKAYYSVETDKEYIAKIKKLTGIRMSFTPLHQGLSTLKTFRNISPEVLAVFKEMSKKGQ